MFQLSEIFGRKVPFTILNFFLENPSREFYETQIREKLKLARASVNKWLKHLVKANLLIVSQNGRMKVYKLNSDNFISKQLKILKNLCNFLPELEALKNKYEIYLYGSSARGEDLEDSDVDILVIGKRSNEVIDVLSKLERKINRKIKPSFYTELEWSQAARKDYAFYERAERDKIRLI
jgi:predicted nucleotidyltransferase